MVNCHQNHKFEHFFVGKNLKIEIFKNTREVTYFNDNVKFDTTQQSTFMILLKFLIHSYITI